MRQIAVRRLGLGLLLGTMLSGLGAVSAWAANSVVVESKNIAKGGVAGVTIGVFVTNDVAIKQCIIPLEFRSVSNGAFITALKRSFPTGTRWDGKLADIKIANQYEDADSSNCATADGGFRQGYGTILNQDQDSSFPVSASPEGVLFVRGIILGATLPAGSDGVTPPIVMTVDIGNNHGTFEIDTTCTLPANHLVFSKTIAPFPLVPSFTKGVVNVLADDVQSLGGDGMPHDYSLDQNYPNPFNASTVIKFNTKHDGHVRIDVYNIIGQKVKTLVDEFRHFGPQAADWDGTDLSGSAVPTGLYFYRLVTSDFTSVKKMLLLK